MGTNMHLEIGKTYKSSDGFEETIMGPTKEYPGWVYSLSGNWYVQETGEFVSYSQSGMFKVLPHPNWRNLVKEINDEL